jgi:hypothetical protein
MGNSRLQQSMSTVVVALGFFLAALAPNAFALAGDRAYELVSPSDTGAVTPLGSTMGQVDGFDCFETSLATADGESVTFNSAMGSLEGLASNGVGNIYEAHRTGVGWVTDSKSSWGFEALGVGGLCLSPDHQFSTLLTGGAPFDEGSLVIGGQQTSYYRTPEGIYLLAGVGSIATDPKANIKWIAEGGAHLILTSKLRLEPEAPAALGSGNSYDGSSPVNAIYDRTPSGLEVVSLLPNGSAPNPSSETTFFRGVSTDGKSVVFEIVKSTGSTLYIHRSGEQTVPIITAAVNGEYRFAGISGDGETVVYLRKETGLAPVRGSIYRYDLGTQSSAPVTVGAEAAMINLSDDGSHVYFTSGEALPGSDLNPLGDTAQPGAPNLYAWSEDSGTQYIATVAPEDVEENVSVHENLTEWMQMVAAPQQNTQTGREKATSRTTSDGSVFIFQAHGNATDYDSSGHKEIFRYDEAGDLDCLSCPTGAASSDAYLQQERIGSIVALNALARLANVTADGRTVVFMSAEPLVEGDTNGTYDVYEWDEGELGLISGGTSASPNLLYAMSEDGRDVFFVTIDQLVPQDESSVQSIYDARVGGGFPPPPPDPNCDGDTCQGGLRAAPLAVSIGTESTVGPGQAKPCKRCRHCKVRKDRKRCRHRKHRSHHRTGDRR